MAQIADIQEAQRTLEENVLRKMDELQAQLQSGGAAKDTVAKVAEEFRTFRELTFNMLSLLRQQIQVCSSTLDVMETRQRRKALIFSGVREVEREDCAALILGILHGSMGLKEVGKSAFKDCHRIGTGTTGRPRPILVKFTNMDMKSVVWRGKTKLKGSPIAVREFLTKVRQGVFSSARLHFGMRSCWTQEGIIVIKSSDGSRHKITSMEELNSLLAKYPKVHNTTPKGVS